MATRHCRYDHKPAVDSSSESTVARHICERHNNSEVSMVSANETLRRTSWSLKWVVAVLLLLMVPGFGLAQSSQNNWDNLKQLASGQQVQVVLNDAKSYRGQLQTVGDDALMLRLATGEQTFERQNVLRVSTRGKSHRGRNALIGLAVGASVGVIVGVASPELGQGKCAQGSCINAASAALAGFVGAAVGTGLGAVLPTDGWHDVYRAATKPRK
jgi:small nuclear ribonucleoprotein (snRNP)-like protein